MQTNPSIDNRPYINTYLEDKSIIDIDTRPKVEAIEEKINDPTLGSLFIAHAIRKIGFPQVAAIAQWATKTAREQGGHAGKLFVNVANKSICEIKEEV